MIVLFAVAVASAFPGRFGVPSWAPALGPVAAGMLAGVGVCQLLTFEAASHPPNSGVAIPGVTWMLGPSPLIVVVGAAVALATWMLTMRLTGRAATPGIRERSPRARGGASRGPAGRHERWESDVGVRR